MVDDGGVVAQHMVSPALVGRGGELSSLLSAVSLPPAAVVIEGEAGIGKTRLLAELREHLHGSGRRVVIGWCRWIREPFPLGPVLEAVRALGEDLSRIPLSPVVGALRPLLPEVAGMLPPQPRPLDDRVADRHRVFRALAEVLGSLGPVVVALEDLHWADGQTIDFVSYLLGDLPAELSLVVTIRGEEVDPWVRALMAKLPPSVTRASVQLRPLDEQTTGVLAAEILDTSRVSRQFARYLHERTSGLPFAIEEVLALLRARGAPVGQRGPWSRESLDKLDVPSGIRDSVLERVDRLSVDARAVVEAAAVVQTPVPPSVLAATCPAPESRIMPAVEEVLESGLLTEDGGRVGFRHLLAAQAVYGEMRGTRRQHLHRNAATALGALHPTPVGQLAHHLRHAGQLTAWVSAAERAADQAAELGHDDEAVRLLKEVLQHAPLETEQRGRIALKLARAAVETLHADSVHGILLEVPTDDLPSQMSSELRFWLALLLTQAGGDPSLQRRLFAEAVAELGDRPDLKAWAMVGLGIPNGDPTVPLSEHLHWLRMSLEILPDMTNPPLEALLLGKAAMVLTAVGDPQWRRLTERIRAQTGGQPSQRREVSAYESVGSDACYAGHHHYAHQLLTAAATGAEVCRSRRLQVRSQARLALLDYCRGRWDGLRERTELLLDELVHYTEARVDAEAVLGGLALAHGDLDLAHQRLTEVVPRVERLGGFDLLPLPATALVRLAVARGDPDTGSAVGQRVLNGVEAKGLWPPGARMLPALAQAMVAAGAIGPARALVDRLAAQSLDLDAPLAPAAVAHARGFLLLGEQQWRPAAEQFRAAAESYQPLSCPYEAAQAYEHAAECLLDAGDPDAAALLRRALHAYQQLGASWDAARAARTARRREVTLPAPHRGGRRGYGDQLSPREQEVAHLAATGLTNEEIARDLFLSPKTVEKHVSAALRKLELDSRHALAQHFRAASPLLR